MEPDKLLTNPSLYAALSKKRTISDCWSVIWCADRSYTLYTYSDMCEGKKKKEEKQNQNFQVQFPWLLDGLMEPWDNFYIRIAKGFHL